MADESPSLIQILLEKLVSALLTLALVYKPHWTTVILLFVVLGQGHFVTAYFYQYKAGKFKASSLLGYGACALGILLAYWHWPNLNLLIAITTVYFLLHMIFDELYLLRLPMELRQSPMHLGRFLEMLPIVFLYTALVLDSLFPALGHSIGLELSSLGTILAASALLLYALVCLVFKSKPDWKSGYFGLWGLLLVLAIRTQALQGVHIGKLTGFIILYHYINWYLHYYLNLQAMSHKVTYLRRVGVINAVVLVAYFTLGDVGIGAYLFREDYFYIWTLLHLISSTRLADLRALMKKP